MTLIALVTLFAACNDTSTPTPKPNVPPATTTPAPQDAPPAPGDSAQILAKFDIVDLAGKPMPNMAPIATERPNAFEKPLVTGLLSNPEGHTEMNVPAKRHLYLRAWDPELKYFANNFYELLPGDGNIANGIVIQMVPGTSVQAQLQGTDGAPLPPQAVGMMLFHPTQGPWWPAESRTDDSGNIHFDRVPAGAYVIKFKAENGGNLDVPETFFPPNGSVNLGTLRLQ